MGAVCAPIEFESLGMGVYHYAIGHGGFGGYIEAKRKLPEKRRPPSRITIRQDWWGYESKDGGTAEIGLDLHIPLLKLVRPHHLTGYFAAALIMPYGRFLRASDATDYDLPVLQRRFGVSFEQLAHRLTTLQRVGQRGLPFFMARLDRAGQFSKRIVGASGAELIEAEHSCPLWIVHKTFERSGELLVQLVNSQSDGQTTDVWFTVGRTVEGMGTSGAAKFSVVLGLDASLAGSLAQARGVSLRPEDAVPIGPGCRRCHIEGCEQRSLPPIGRRLRFDPVSRGATPFEFGDRGITL